MAGCPCSGFDCLVPTSVPEATTATIPTTTATTVPTTTSLTVNAVLVLSTYISDNKPFIVDFNGNYFLFDKILKLILLHSGNINEGLAFEFGIDTQVQYGCAATMKNEFWYFGGYSSYNRQVRL